MILQIVSTTNHCLRQTPICICIYLKKSHNKINTSESIPQSRFSVLSLTAECSVFRADLSIDVPDFLDLNRFRATGLQAGEEELPDLSPPIVLPEDTRGTATSPPTPRHKPLPNRPSLGQSP